MCYWKWRAKLLTRTCTLCSWHWPPGGILKVYRLLTCWLPWCRRYSPSAFRIDGTAVKCPLLLSECSVLHYVQAKCDAAWECEGNLDSNQWQEFRGSIEATGRCGSGSVLPNDSNFELCLLKCEVIVCSDASRGHWMYGLVGSWLPAVGWKWELFAHPADAVGMQRLSNYAFGGWISTKRFWAPLIPLIRFFALFIIPEGHVDCAWQKYHKTCDFLTNWIAQNDEENGPGVRHYMFKFSVHLASIFTGSWNAEVCKNNCIIFTAWS